MLDLRMGKAYFDSRRQFLVRFARIGNILEKVRGFEYRIQVPVAGCLENAD